MYFLNMGEKVKSIRICNADLCVASSLKAFALTWCSKTLEDLQENTLSDAEAAGSQQLWTCGSTTGNFWVRVQAPPCLAEWPQESYQTWACPSFYGCNMGKKCLLIWVKQFLTQSSFLLCFSLDRFRIWKSVCHIIKINVNPLHEYMYR